MVWSEVCCFIFMSLFLRVTCQPLLVQTALGSVEGVVAQSRDGREYNSFRGIPYATPPIGKLRFQNPEPILSFDGTIDATRDATYCIQKDTLTKANATVQGQEDCLFLNIYAPRTNNTNPLPVLVYLFGGGFFSGYASSTYLGADYFMDQDLILVTLNYRLGAFGFLSTLDDYAPGNLGLKDQALALEWIKQHITSFGGDPSKVTIMGESAGSGAVHHHIVSPRSAGLFHRAILQSGTALSFWGDPMFDEEMTNATASQAGFVGCGDFVSNHSALIECLQAVDAQVLADSATDFPNPLSLPAMTFRMVYEKASPKNPKPFITERPLISLLKGTYNKVSFIQGGMQYDGDVVVENLLRVPKNRDLVNADFDNSLDAILLLSHSTKQVKKVVNSIVNFYLNGQHFVDVNNPKSVQGFINAVQDRFYTSNMYQNIAIQFLNNPNPIYIYNLAYQGQFSYGNVFAKTDQNINFNWGASHADDLILLFKIDALFGDLQGSDVIVSKTLVKAWANFVIQGNPDPDRTLNWTPVRQIYPLKYLNITGSVSNDEVNFRTDQHLYTNRVKFWLKQPLHENRLL